MIKCTVNDSIPFEPFSVASPVLNWSYELINLRRLNNFAKDHNIIKYTVYDLIHF